jgi:hypothetical protein
MYLRPTGPLGEAMAFSGEAIGMIALPEREVVKFDCAGFGLTHGQSCEVSRRLCDRRVRTGPSAHRAGW